MFLFRIAEILTNNFVDLFSYEKRLPFFSASLEAGCAALYCVSVVTLSEQFLLPALYIVHCTLYIQQKRYLLLFNFQ